MMKVPRRHAPDFSVLPPDTELVDGATLARILGVSKKCIDDHALDIPGSLKVGRLRRYHVPTLRYEIMFGEDILKKDVKKA